MTKDNDHLICFDLDGTLISSMAIANRIFYETVHEELGLPLHDYPKQRALMALSAEERMDTLWRNEIRERGITHDQITHALQSYRNRKMTVNIPLIPYAADAVRLMAEHFRFLACVSSNADYIVRQTLARIGLDSYFSLVVGMDRVEFSKPDPAIYRQAVEHYGMNPKMCVTFEDSTPGLRSAIGAGLRTIAVATGLESESELKKTGPDLVWPDLSGITIKKVTAVFQMA